MAKPTMNRWIVVVCAILIQLALGAIYAWSVFTPGLTLPLVQEDFGTDDIVVIDGIGYTVELGGVYDSPVVDADPQEMTISVVDVNGQHFDGRLDVIMVTYITDEDGAVIEEVVEKGETIYDANDGSTKYTYSFRMNPVTTPQDVNLTANGNWHVDIIITSPDADVSDRNASFLVNDGITGEFGFDKTQTQIVFATGLATFALMTIVAGKVIMPRIGPRMTAIMGGVLLGIGYIGAGAVGQTFIAQMLLIGIVGGAGIGLGYVVPIAVCIKWFPDKKGLITGLGVAGFGFGAFLWVQLGNGYLGTLIADLGTLAVFQLYGIIFLILVVISSLVMVNPPEGYRPRGWRPPKETSKTSSTTGGVEFESGEMLRTRQFWTIWTLFVFGALAGLMVIGNIAIYGIDTLQDSGFEKAEAAKVAATAMALFAITNGLGRIAWGASLRDNQRPRAHRLGSVLGQAWAAEEHLPHVPDPGRPDDRVPVRRSEPVDLHGHRDGHRIQLRRQLHPIPDLDRRLLRQRERRKELRVRLLLLWSGRYRGSDPRRIRVVDGGWIRDGVPAGWSSVSCRRSAGVHVDASDEEGCRRSEEDRQEGEGFRGGCPGGQRGCPR